MRDLGWIEADGEPDEMAMAAGRYLRAVGDDTAALRTTRDGIPLDQILRDRPDVFAAYFGEFHGTNNDTRSSAWIDRVGGVTVQDYANYWYEQHGRWEGYGARSGGGASAPDEDGGPRLPPGIVETGRVTSDGIPLSQILSDRPDVFRAFFTEYYGRNNDHHSSAWTDRVGGATPEDYANYWYERHGRWGDYVPASRASAGAEDEEPPVVVAPSTEHDHGVTPDDPDPSAGAAPWPDEVGGDDALLVGRTLCDPGDALCG